MVDAVLFDWGDTLMSYEGVLDEELMRQRTQTGLAALARPEVPDAGAIGAWFAARTFDPDREDEDDYLALVTMCFSELGCALSEQDVRLYAEESLSESGLLLHPQSHALLDSLRERGLRTALVSNTALPLSLLAPVFERQGLTERLDAIVLSSEVGKRKPHPLIFEHALEELGVAPDRALFVGDRLLQDVRGAAEAGMATVQALWSRADDHPDGREPDYRAFTQMDVLNVVRRLNGEA